MGFAVVVKELAGGAGRAVRERVVQSRVGEIKVGKVGSCGTNGAVGQRVVESSVGRIVGEEGPSGTN